MLYFVDEIEHLDNITVLSRYNYSYDDVGNRTSMTVTADDLSQTVHSYDYDDAYRLITETTNMGSANLVTSYQYDRAGNRTQMSNGEGITTYNYNANDELTRIDKPDFYFEDYSYDLRGNLVQVEAGGHGTYSSTNYAYNAKDQMVSYGLGSTPFITYDYNHADNRVAQTVSGTTTNYLWDEFSHYKDVILETNPSNTIGYTLAAGMLVSQTNNGNTDYFLQDAQNSTIGIADSSGAVTSSYAYDAFGNLDSSISGVSVETNYLYTGQQFDPVYTELYNLRARQYDPSIGRFSSRDKWAYNYENPVELNRYGYAQNNPVNFYDPSGYNNVAMYALGLGAAGVTYLLLLQAATPNSDPAVWAAAGAWFGRQFQRLTNALRRTTDEILSGNETSGSGGDSSGNGSNDNSISDEVGNSFEYSTNDGLNLPPILIGGTPSGLENLRLGGYPSGSEFEFPSILVGGTPSGLENLRLGGYPSGSELEFPSILSGPEYQIFDINDFIFASDSIRWRSPDARRAYNDIIRYEADEVYVPSRSDAEEIALALIIGAGYINTTGMNLIIARDWYRGQGTYHWDEELDEDGALAYHPGAREGGALHAEYRHLQIHTPGGEIIRILFGNRLP